METVKEYLAMFIMIDACLFMAILTAGFLYIIYDLFRRGK